MARAVLVAQAAAEAEKEAAGAAQVAQEAAAKVDRTGLSEQEQRANRDRLRAHRR